MAKSNVTTTDYDSSNDVHVVAKDDVMSAVDDMDDKKIL